MKTLLILRHAKSSWKDEALPDRERPLAKRGVKDAPRMGELLREQDLLPDLILSSSAKRARMTVELVADASGYGGDILFSDEIYSFDPEAYLKALQELPDQYERVMLVGHNPGLQELLEQLTDQAELLPTAALAQVRLPIQSWRELGEETQGELVNLWLPKEL